MNKEKKKRRKKQGIKPLKKIQLKFIVVVITFLLIRLVEFMLPIFHAKLQHWLAYLIKQTTMCSFFVFSLF